MAKPCQRVVEKWCKNWCRLSESLTIIRTRTQTSTKRYRLKEQIVLFKCYLSIITVEKAVDILVIWLKFAKYFFTATFQPSNPVLKESPSSWQGVAQLPRKEKAKLSPKTTHSLCLLLPSYSKDPRGQSELLSLYFCYSCPLNINSSIAHVNKIQNFGNAIWEFDNAELVRLQPAWPTPPLSVKLCWNNDQLQIAMIDPHHLPSHQY